jgi:hypothetical protein
MNPKPVLHLRSSVTRLHCRPAELYLGAGTIQGSFQIICFFDKNVYAPDTVQEWIEEVHNAAYWYLGKDTGSAGLDNKDPLSRVQTKL